MIKNIILDFLAIVAVVVLYTTKYVSLPIYEVKPDIALILTVFIGVFGGRYNSLFFGFACGLAIDFVDTASPLGFNALIYTIIGYLSILPNKLFQIESSLLGALIILFFFFIKSVLFLIFGYMFLDINYLIKYFNSKFGIELIYTLVVSIIIFLIFHKIYKFFESSKKHVQ